MLCAINRVSRVVSGAFFRSGQKKSTLVKNLTGIFLLLMFLSGCAITASSGSRTEYEDKMKIIEKDYKEMKITKDEYIRLKKQAGQQGSVGQTGGERDSGQSLR